VLVHNSIYSVPAADDCNTEYKNGRQTNKAVTRFMSREEFKDRYATFNPDDGEWYYNGNP